MIRAVLCRLLSRLFPYVEPRDRCPALVVHIINATPRIGSLK